MCTSVFMTILMKLITMVNEGKKVEWRKGEDKNSELGIIFLRQKPWLT